MVKKSEKELQFNPDMLILARESRGMSQTQLAQKSGLQQNYVSRYETGLRPMSKPHLEQLATALEYPVEFFLQREPRYGFGSSTFHHRRRQSVGIKIHTQEIARSNIKRIHLSKLIRSLDIEGAYEFPRLDLDDYPGGPEWIAQELRRQWGIHSGPIRNLTTVIEDGGGIIVLGRLATRKIDGISQWLPGLPPMFFINSQLPGDRCRWTLAHETGHLVMHHLPTQNPEVEADKFAAEFLMPRAEIEGSLRISSLYDLERLKYVWKVSMAALLRRAKELGRISADTYTNLNIELSKAGYKTHEPIPIPIEKPTLLRGIFDLHLDELTYSLEELASILNISCEELIREYPDELEGRFQGPRVKLRPQKDFELISFDRKVDST